MSWIPFWVVSRSDSAANRRGIQLSTAMLASTRGPSMKPACAATTSRIPSENSVTTDSTRPPGSGAVMVSTSTAFSVLPGTGVMCHSR